MRKYGSIYGDIYIAKTAPASNPEQVFFGRAMQTGSISDDYWKIIFQEDLLREPRKVCSAADYIQSYTVELEGGYTERAWKPEDDWNEVLKASQGNIRINLVFEEGQSDEDYADYILYFLESLLLYNQPKADVSLNARIGEKGAYIFFETFPKEEGYTRLPREELMNSIKETKESWPIISQ